MTQGEALLIRRGCLAEANRMGFDSLSEDLAQDAILKMITTPEPTPRPNKFRVIDAARRFFGRKWGETVALGEHLKLEPDLSPSQIVDLPLHRLTERERTVFLLIGLYEFTGTEVSRITGLSNMTVNLAYARAKEKMRDETI